MNFAQAKLLRLDIKYFKAFLAVAEFKNFTIAAEKAAMTQSVVSQHIAKLEDQIGQQLFLRTGKEAVLTDAGQHVFKFANTLTEDVSALFETINSDHDTLEGLVRFCMPPSCILSSHFPILMERSLEHPELELKVELAPNRDVYCAVLNANCDYGFITEMVESPMLRYRHFCQEEYILVSGYAEHMANLDGDKLLHQKYIAYPGMECYMNLWLQHCFPEKPHLSERSLTHGGEVNTIDGAILMVRGKLGMSVFPRHTVQKYIDAGELFEYQRKGLEPLLNSIYIVTHKNVQQPNRVKAVINWFLDMYPDRPKSDYV